MFLIDDILAAKAAGKIVPALVGAGLVFGAGFAGAEVYEHKAPWGLAPKLERLTASIPGRLASERSAGRTDGIHAQSASDAVAFGQWSDQLKLCQSLVLTQRDTSARAITQAEANNSASASAAYRLGRATCGATDALTPPDPPDPSAPPGDRPAIVLHPSGADLGDIVNSGAAATRRP